MTCLEHYRLDGKFDEYISGDGALEPFVANIAEHLSTEVLHTRQQLAMDHLRQLGITFNVYGHDDGVEKVWPMDILPRVIGADEWATVENGLKQRIRALNLFLDDIYGEQRIVADGAFPRELIASADSFRSVCQGQQPPHGVWTHVTGTDLIRHSDGTIYVLEDNLRCPSGVSYVLENREVMKRVLPELFSGVGVAPVEDYPERLLKTLIETAPEGSSDPTVVLLTPGVYNSAYFEHCFLAQQMGVELVSGNDLIVQDGVVKMRTTKGLEQVDVIYRRIDDDFLDPCCFREDSLLGVPGLMEVYHAGKVTLANAPGNGVADDKAVYAYVPEFIRFYLSEEPILANVPTYVCDDTEQQRYVLDHLEELVVKPTNESGGYGIVLGPVASMSELEATAAAIKNNPRNFIAQPMLCLSTVPTVTEAGLAPRHVDLRPYILYGKDIHVLPGGLTRVALTEGSMIVNSSQGGGSKDTWVLTK